VTRWKWRSVHRCGRRQLGRESDPLVGRRRRHADVGDHDVGSLLVDRHAQTTPVSATSDNLDVRVPVECALDPLTHEEIVFAVTVRIVVAG
jgi:hypothetical protein